jgi:hypothetical protein
MKRATLHAENELFSRPSRWAISGWAVYRARKGKDFHSPLIVSQSDIVTKYIQYRIMKESFQFIYCHVMLILFIASRCSIAHKAIIINY